MDKRNKLFPDENREILTIAGSHGKDVDLALYAQIYVDDEPYYFTLDVDGLDNGELAYFVLVSDEDDKDTYHIVLDEDIETSVLLTFKKMLKDYQNK